MILILVNFHDLLHLLHFLSFLHTIAIIRLGHIKQDSHSTGEPLKTSFKASKNRKIYIPSKAVEKIDNNLTLTSGSHRSSCQGMYRSIHPQHTNHLYIHRLVLLSIYLGVSFYQWLGIQDLQGR